MSLPMRTVLIPERAIKELLHENETMHDFIGFRHWDRLAHDKLAVVTLTEGWIAEILEAAVKPEDDVVASFRALIDDSPTIRIGTETRALIKHLLKHKEDRDIYIAALRLGGIQNVYEMLKAQRGNS